MSQQLADQLGWCSTSKDYLKDLSYAVDSAKTTLDNTINMLHQENFAEFNALLYELQKKYETGSTETQKFIHDHHIKYLEDRIKFIGTMLNQLNGGNN